MIISAFNTSVRREKSTFSQFQPANIQQIINVEKFFYLLLRYFLVIGFAVFLFLFYDFANNVRFHP